MELVSSARSTILSGFPNLETKFIYHHSQDEATDFQFFAKKRLFIEVNKKSGLEFLRIRTSTNSNKNEKKNTVNVASENNIVNNDHNSGGTTISHVRKMRVDNLYCIACPKQSYDEIALGLSNGLIKLIDYKSKELKSKFAAESRNSVISLDFNASDEYLSSVYENGIINIYGIKTKTKMETINIDSNATLARFHPVKKFHLSIASYKGSVFIYDIQAKRKIYQSIEGHAAPCRDLCMSESQPDLLLSIGYDCIVNLYDTRKKSQPQQIKCEYPLSTVAMSECGYYFCVGNLKGELISYDLRNMKNSIVAKKIYETAVVRVAFVPKDISAHRQSTIFTNSSSFNSLEIIPPERQQSIGIVSQQQQKTTRDSFGDFLDFHSYKGKDDKVCNKFATRESFDWQALNHNQVRHTIDNAGSENIPITYKITDDSLLSSNLLNKPSNNSDIVKTINNSLDVNGNNSIEKEQSMRKSINFIKKRLTDVKENDQINENIEDDIDSNNYINTPINNSTPNNNNYKNRIILAQSPRSVETFNIQYEIRKQLQELRLDVDKKFQELESEIKFNAECNKWHIFTQNFNLWKDQKSFNSDIKDSIDCLIQTDEFYQEFMRLKVENEELKNKLLEISKKNNRFS